jgi:hypothetical protein
MVTSGGSNRLSFGDQPASVEASPTDANVAFARLFVVLGIVLAVSGLVVLPVGLIFLLNRGWEHLINVAWLVLPAISLLVSLRDWLRNKRVGATADVIVACGVACIWLFLVLADVTQAQGNDMGLVPYIACGALLVFTIGLFAAFVRLVSPDGQLAHSTVLGWLYWTLCVACILVMAVTYFLTLYYQIWLA